MNRYAWPNTRTDAERDDPAGRAGFLGPRRTELNLAAALADGRRIAPRPRPAGRPGVFAQPTSRAEMWVPLGPSTVIEGQANGDPRVTGRVRSISVHPDGDRLYAATANGGVWYSSDGGESWRSLGGFAPTDSPDIVRPAHRHACGAILVRLDSAAPDDESKDTVFVGTGELEPDDGRAGGQLGGIGVLVARGPATSTDIDPWVEEAPNLREQGVYRLAAEPGGSTIVAATTIGLMQRPAGAGAGTEWARVAGTPFNGFTGVVTDVLWTAAVAAGPPGRLWAWVQGGDQAGLWVRDDGDTNFEKIATPGFFKRRGSLAAADPPSTVYVFNDRHSSKPANAKLPALYRVTSAAGTKPTAAFVTGVPDMLGHQGFYDLAITVDPNNPDQVVLGGSFTEGPPDKPAVTGQNVNVSGQSYQEDAAIFTAEVGDNAGTLTYGHATPPLRIGVGCHADVHDLHYSDGDVLWAACDGGVFRSIYPDQSSAFVARNNGLNVVEANYVASHPTCEGRVVVGLQDNGIIERGSSTVWFHTGNGDGGGVAFDPRQTTRFVRQFFNGQWTGSDGGPFRRMLAFRPLAAPFNLHADAQKERDDAAFYSTPAAIAHVRGAAAAPTHTQVLIGTTRVWYTDDWASTWVTLPSGRDPVTTLTFDRSQDLFGEEITVCKWATSDVAWILGNGRLQRLVRLAGSDAAGGPGTWSRDPILEKEAKNKKDETSAEGPIREASVWTDVEPNPDAGGAMHGPKGAVYLGTVGDPDDDDVDTLWWFDGDETWHPTGLRTHPQGVEAPVTAVRCDPANPDDVYVGTTVGVWYGVRTLGDPPTWDWRPLVNGLPEAAVEDLSLFDGGADLRLLRAAIAARGVWELRLGADVEDLTYVRAHDDDLRYRARAIEVQGDGATARSWHGSPDVRPRLAPAVMPAPIATLTQISPGPVERLRRFQAALRSQSGDDRVRATGRWDLYFEDVLRDLGAPAHPVTNRMQIDGPYWSSVMVAAHATADPWSTANPAEADLMDLTPRLGEGDAGSVSCVLKAQPYKVDVVVHHRGLDARPGADVRVTLLRWIRPAAAPVPRRDDPATWFTDNVPWAAAVDDVLNSAGGATSRTFDEGWRFVGSNAAARRKTLAGQDLDNTRSGVVTFDLDLSAFRNNTVMLLAAVIRAGADSSVATASLADLALEDPHVAVRSIVIERP